MSEAKGQGFGCFDLDGIEVYDGFQRNYLDGAIPWGNSDINLGGIYIDWHNFISKTPKDGFYKEFYKSSKYIPKKLKLSGNIKNGLPEGIWFFYIECRNDFLTGNYIKGKKEGLWSYYRVTSKGDTILDSSAEFINDILFGKKKDFSYDGKISEISNYTDGLKDGEEIYYSKYGKKDVISISSRSFYKMGLLDGKTTLYFNDGGIATEIEYKEGMMDGEFSEYIFGYEYKLIFRDNLPYTVISAIDLSGNKLDAGTLKEGTGVLNSYFEDGQLKYSVEFKNQLVSGFVKRYSMEGELLEDGQIFCERDGNAVNFNPNFYIDDFINHSIRQQKYTVGTRMVFYNGEKGFSKFESFPSDTTSLMLMKYQRFSSDSVLLQKNIRVNKMIVGKETKYFNNGQIAKSGNYKLVNIEGDIVSKEDGIFTYYFENGTLRAEVNYCYGVECGTSYYYDESGELRRIRVVTNVGAVYNVFDGDTVNAKDENGLRQGKWISFPYLLSENDCNYTPDSRSFYKDDKPTGVWEYYSYDGVTISEKYTWKESDLAHLEIYGFSGNLISEGDVFNLEVKTGLWKEYDLKKGFLKREGNYEIKYINRCYIGERKEGIWKTYNKRGKLKKEVLYKNGEKVL